MLPPDPMMLISVMPCVSKASSVANRSHTSGLTASFSRRTVPKL